MKHIVGLIIMALIVLSLYLAPVAGSWVIVALGSVGIFAAIGALLQADSDVVKALIQGTLKDTIKPWQSALLHFARSLLFVALVYGVALPSVSVSAKILALASYLLLQLPAGRIASLKNTLLRKAYTVKA